MPPKPMKDRLVIAAASRVMGRPLKGAGGSQASTRLRTPLNMTIASMKPTPAPMAQTRASM